MLNTNVFQVVILLLLLSLTLNLFCSLLFIIATEGLPECGRKDASTCSGKCHSAECEVYNCYNISRRRFKCVCHPCKQRNTTKAYTLLRAS